MKVQNMTSQRRHGREVANQFIIWQGQMEWFQSYDKIIAQVDRGNGQVTLDEKSWDYSATTGVYRNQFLGEGIAETRKKIASGEYKLANLNDPRVI